MASHEELTPVLEAYGRSQPETWAGASIETRTGVYVALFTDDLAAHEASLRRLISPRAQVAVRQARWSLADLFSERDAMVRDLDWLADFHAWFAGSGIDIAANRVTLNLSTKNVATSALAMERYEGDGWLVVQADGVGRWEGELGSARISAVDPTGAPVLHLSCQLIPDDPAAWPTESYTTGFDGTCPIEGIAATTYDVEMQWRQDDASPWQVVGRGRIAVPAGGLASIVVRVDVPD